MEIILACQTRQVFSSGLYVCDVTKDKRRADMMCGDNNAVITDSSSIWRQEVSNFHISGSTKHKKVFERCKG